MMFTFRIVAYKLLVQFWQNLQTSLVIMRGAAGAEQIRRASIIILKKFINNSRGKYKRNECLINVCKSDKDLS